MTIVDELLTSDEPSIRFKAKLALTAKTPAPRTQTSLRKAIANSSRVAALLSERDSKGKIPHHPYSKWRGAHWVLADLADLGYPPGDTCLLPLRDQVYDWLFSEDHQKRFTCINGLWRRCASQEGNAIYYLNTLGLADERTNDLVDRLENMQWPDGGWNCRRDLDAEHSSFMETITPMRGMIAHGKSTGSRKAKKMAKAASEIFLKRHLYRRQTNGNVIQSNFTKLHHPLYWHYDILFALKVLGEGGFARDKRTEQAIDLLVSKQLPDGGFPAEARFYQKRSPDQRGNANVDWGKTGKKTANPFVSVEALSVLKAAGRPLVSP